MNIGSGHYILRVSLEKGWQRVIFNNEEDALPAHPPMKHAYMYLFQTNNCLGSPLPRFEKHPFSKTDAPQKILYINAESMFKSPLGC
jgi:hypothetical protein